MAYSLDYRKRALTLLEQGRSCSEVSETMGIDRKTLYNWKKRQEAGHLDTNYPLRRGAYRINEEAIKAHLKENPDAYLSELAKVAGGSIEGTRHALKRLGISRKKRRRYTKKEM